MFTLTLPLGRKDIASALLSVNPQANLEGILDPDSISKKKRKREFN